MRTRSLGLFILIILLFSGCVSSQKNTYKLSFKPEAITKKEGANFFIIPPSIFIMNDAIIKKNSEKIYSAYKDYLRKNKFIIVESPDFEDKYYKAVKSKNGLFDPVTGKFDSNKQSEILFELINQVDAKKSIDYFIVPTFVFKRVKISKTSKFGRWDGVERNLKIHNKVNVYPKNPLAISLYTKIYSLSNGLVLSNRVGLDFIVEVIKKRSASQIKRCESLFDIKFHVEETIEKSFDPFIPL